VLEEVIERYLSTEVAKVGARSDKCVNMTRIGWPDRTVQWPGLGIDLVELKKPGEKPEAHQVRVHEFLASCGEPVYVIDTKEKVDLYVATRLAGLHCLRMFSVQLPAHFFRDPTDPHE
jgi:hypothetical protein